MKEYRIIMGLCEGRHNIVTNDGIVVKDFIFENEIDPLNLQGMSVTARLRLEEACLTRPVEYRRDEHFVYHFHAHLDLYVTGLTVALIEVIEEARMIFDSVSLWHYDRNSDSYYEQIIGVVKNGQENNY